MDVSQWMTKSVLTIKPHDILHHSGSGSTLLERDGLAAVAWRGAGGG